MIELEIQGLAEKRDGLLIDVGRLAVANGFTLQRQRLALDPHGVLLTMVVRGPHKKARALEAALATYERLMSFQLAPFIDGNATPHFAATRKPTGYTPPPAPAPAAPLEPSAPIGASAPVAASMIHLPISSPAQPLVIERTVAVETVPEPKAPEVQEDDVEFLRRISPARAPAPAEEVSQEAPFVEVIPLEADELAVEKLLRELPADYPQIVPHLLTLDRGVAAGARESSLYMAGQQIGAWVSQREHEPVTGLQMKDAIARIGVPALQAIVDVEQDGDQLHIRHSPLCSEHDRSGCRFFSGFLDGLLAAAVPSGSLSIFEVCCRSYGADDCVLAMSY
jgi:predicted hydrocarbon binding protein